MRTKPTTHTRGWQAIQFCVLWSFLLPRHRNRARVWPDARPPPPPPPPPTSFDLALTNGNLPVPRFLVVRHGLLLLLLLLLSVVVVVS